MSTPLIRRPESDGASTQAASVGATSPAEYALPATLSGIGAQIVAMLALATGVWVALSPWLLTLQYAGTNATTVNVISGLVVAAAAAFALASPRGFAGLQGASALLGVWLIIAGPILNQKHPIADPMYWSNSFAGGLLVALAVVGFAAIAMRRPVRR